MFLTVDGTLWVQLVNFAIFFALLNVLFLRPVGEAIRKRRAFIDKVHGDYDAAMKSLREARGEADQKRGAARRQADEVIARTRVSAENEAAAIVTAQTLEAQTITDLARATVATEMATARARSNQLAASLADTLLERAVGEPR